MSAFRLAIHSAVALTAVPAAAAVPTGVFRNPSNTVHIRTEACGTELCGTVIWASEGAKKNVARNGRAPLVGSRLFRDFKPTGAKSWKGKLFVPDIGRTFSGTITLTSPTVLRGKGCLIGKFLCKSQDWTRVG